MSSLPRGPRQTFIVCAVISHPITHAATTSRPEQPSFSPSAMLAAVSGLFG